MAGVNKIWAHLEGRHRKSPGAEGSHQSQSDGCFSGTTLDAADDDAFNENLPLLFSPIQQMHDFPDIHIGHNLLYDH
jgi:hypothetical protein